MRVMISAGGTVTAQSVVKALREDGRASFVAIVDLDDLNATKAFVDEFVRVPPADDPAFVPACLDAVRRLGIEFFIPIIVEREFLPLEAAREQFANFGCRVAVPSREIVLNAGDKLAFAAFLERLGIAGPKTVAYAPEMRSARFPAYLKPRRGSGSVGTQRVESEEALHEAARGRFDLIVQDAVDGTEFTVDCFAAEPGRVVAAVPRERIAIKAGVSVKGRTYHHPGIETIASDVVARTGIAGPANVQGMLREDGSFSIIEMNPRFSGTLALTTAAGINFASLLLDQFEGKPIADMRGRHHAGITMMRYWSEFFEDPDGKAWLGTTMATCLQPDERR
ncbi:MAG: ATP-grasp domain-containing protein [Candidatus Tumulicola sp.]